MAKTRKTEKDVYTLATGSQKASKKSITKGLIKAGVFKDKEDIKNSIETELLNLKMEEMKKNISCPHCNNDDSSTIISSGLNNKGFRRYKCQKCNKKFTIFTNTIFDNSRYTPEVWIDLIYYMLNHHSVQEIINDLEYKYENKYTFSPQTIYDMRRKI